MKTFCFLLFLILLSAGIPAGYSEPKFSDRGVNRTRTEDKKTNRVYSVYVSELDWDAMTQYARSKEWDGEGTSTVVCFFDDWRNTPDVTFSGLDFSESYKDNWVAGYWRYANGNEVFVQYPARRREMSFY